MFRSSALSPLATVALAGVLIAASSSSAAAIPEDPAATWGTDGRVNVLMPVGEKIFVAGQFNTLLDTTGTGHAAGNLGLFDPLIGSFQDFNVWTNGAVSALAVDGDTLYLAGQFTEVLGQPRRRLAAVSISTETVIPEWVPQTSGQVNALAVVQGSVLVAGNFARVRDTTGTDSGPYLARLGTGQGQLLPAPQPDAAVRALATSDDKQVLYLGGDFMHLDTESTPRIARLSASSPKLAVDQQFRAGPTNGGRRSPVISLALTPTQLLAASGGTGGGCAALDATTGATTWTKHANGDVQAVAFLNGQVFCGGHFGGNDAFDGEVRTKLAQVDGATGVTDAYSPRINSALGVWALASDGTRLFVGGDFTRFGRNRSAAHFCVVT